MGGGAEGLGWSSKEENRMTTRKDELWCQDLVYLELALCDDEGEYELLHWPARM